MNNYIKFINYERKLHIIICKYIDIFYPNIFYLCTNHESKRTFYEIFTSKIMRLKSGLPDIIIPLLNNNYLGLGIELKIQYNKIDINQFIIINKLRKCGWKIKICFFLNEIITSFIEYLN